MQQNVGVAASHSDLQYASNASASSDVVDSDDSDVAKVRYFVAGFVADNRFPTFVRHSNIIDHNE